MARGSPNRVARQSTTMPIRGGLALIAALAYLAFVLMTRGEDEPPVPVAVGGDSTGATVTLPSSNGPLRYRGVLPAGLSETAFVPAAEDEDPDLTFATTTDGAGEIFRYWQPVTALGVGLDGLTPAQLTFVTSARGGNWQASGGVPGPVTFAVAGPEADQAMQLRLSGRGEPAATSFATYDELRAAMTMDSGILALVPLSEVRPSMTALAMDGVDLVRGVGDVTAWPYVERLTITGDSKRGKEAATALLPQLAAKAPVPIRVVATGDILMSRCTLAKIRASGDWGAPLRSPVGEYLAAADLALGSLDGSIQDINDSFGCVSGTNLSSPVETIEALTLAGFDGLTVATNHVFDCGVEFCGSRAFLRTLEVLDGAGIKHVGGGVNLEAALAPAIFEVGGVRFGVLGFDDVAAQDLEATDIDPGTAPLDDSYAEERAAGEPAFYRPADELDITRFQERIRLLKTQVDVVIVQVQSGTEDTHTPTERSIKALRGAVDAGADLVVGNQAHWVQAVEPWGDAYITYALGNFIFDQLHTPEHSQGVILEATFWGKQLVNVKLLPYEIVDQLKPTFVEGAVRTKILGDVYEAAAELPAETPE